jgi:hypothetical protein
LGNLIPITMQAANLDLEGASQSVVQDIYDCIREFDDNASALRAEVTAAHTPDAARNLGRLIEAYQAIATTVLNFSIQSPRYGLLKDRQGDGSFLVTL